MIAALPFLFVPLLTNDVPTTEQDESEIRFYDLSAIPVTYLDAGDPLKISLVPYLELESEHDHEPHEEDGKGEGHEAIAADTDQQRLVGVGRERKYLRGLLDRTDRRGVAVCVNRALLKRRIEMT